MRRTLLLGACLLASAALAGCQKATPAPDDARDGWFEPSTEEALALIGIEDPAPSEDLYQQSLPLFDYDLAAPLDVQEISRRQEGEATWIDLTFASPMGGRVPSTLVIPDGPGPFAGIVLQHGMPARRDSLFSAAGTYAKHGAVVVLIDAPFSRVENEIMPGMIQSTWFDERDAQLQIQFIVDLQRAVDLLVARPEVDPERLAYIGYSYGGAMGGLLAGVETRLQAYVLVVGDGGLVEHTSGLEEVYGLYYSGLFQRPEEQQRAWLERMWPIEPIHFVGHAAPATLLFQNGVRDSQVPPQDALAYQQAGSEPKEVLWYDADHGLGPRAAHDHVRWLQSYIGDRLFFLRPSFRAQTAVLDRAILAWTLAGLACLAFVILDLRRRGARSIRGWLQWSIALAVFGPLGLGAYLLTQGGLSARLLPEKETALWRRALGATAWSTSAMLIGILAAVYANLLEVPIVRANPLLIGLGIYIVLGMFPGAVLTLVDLLDRSRDLELLIRRPVLAELTTLNIVMAVSTVAMNLTSARYYPLPVNGVDPVVVVMVVAGGILGAASAYPVNAWMLRRGIARWEPAAETVSPVAQPFPPVWRRNLEACGVWILSTSLMFIAVLYGVAISAGIPFGDLLAMLSGGG